MQVPLDKTYPDYTTAVTVRVWADSGRVMDALRQVSYPSYAEVFGLPLTPFFGILELVFIGAVLVIGVVLVIVGLSKSRKGKLI